MLLANVWGLKNLCAADTLQAPSGDVVVSAGRAVDGRGGAQSLDATCRSRDALQGSRCLMGDGRGFSPNGHNVADRPASLLCPRRTGVRAPAVGQCTKHLTNVRTVRVPHRRGTVVAVPLDVIAYRVAKEFPRAENRPRVRGNLPQASSSPSMATTAREGERSTSLATHPCFLAQLPCRVSACHVGLLSNNAAWLGIHCAMAAAAHPAGHGRLPRTRAPGARSWLRR